MCKTPKVPASETPAPAPAPPAPSAATAQGDVIREEDNDTSVQKARKKGRNALRIKLDAGNTGGSTGLNIPQA